MAKIIILLLLICSTAQAQLFNVNVENLISIEENKITYFDLWENEERTIKLPEPFYRKIKYDDVVFFFRVHSTGTIEQHRNILDNFNWNKVPEQFLVLEYYQAIKTINAMQFSETEKAWMIANWIIKNIEYKDGVYYENVAQILENKAGVCGEFSLLFWDMAKNCGMQSDIQLGMAGGLHAWNVVQIDGYWYPIDVTWMAGTEIDIKYFLSNLDKFYSEHKPGHEELILKYQHENQLRTESSR